MRVAIDRRVRVVEAQSTHLAVEQSVGKDDGKFQCNCVWLGNDGKTPHAQ